METYLSPSDQRHQEKVFFSSLVPFSYSFSTIFCPQLSFSSSTFSSSYSFILCSFVSSCFSSCTSSLLSPSSLLPLHLPSLLENFIQFSLPFCYVHYSGMWSAWREMSNSSQWYKFMENIIEWNFSASIFLKYLCSWVYKHYLFINYYLTVC